MPASQLAAEVARFTELLATERQRAVVNLRQLEERWARFAAGLPDEGDLVAAARTAVEGGAPSDPGEAIRHLAEAERWQWEIGSWATGSGEGLASMFQVRSLQLARAWLLSTATDPDATATDPDATARAEAAKLLEEVANDPNRIADRHSDAIEALRSRLTP